MRNNSGTSWASQENAGFRTSRYYFGSRTDLRQLRTKNIKERHGQAKKTD